MARNPVGRSFSEPGSETQRAVTGQVPVGSESLEERSEEMKMSQAEVDKTLADWPRIKPAPATPIENWYYLDVVFTLHQLGKWQGFDAAYVEMERVSAERGTPYFILICEDQAKDWRAQLDRWLGNDGYTQKYKKRKGDL